MVSLAPKSLMPRPLRPPGAHYVPFKSSEDAWFWTMNSLRARRDGRRASTYGGSLARPCEPDDVVGCLDNLFRSHDINADHARVLRQCGDQQAAPDPQRGPPRDLKLWREALDRLDAPLRRKGIVA